MSNGLKTLTFLGAFTTAQQIVAVLSFSGLEAELALRRFAAAKYLTIRHKHEAMFPAGCDLLNSQGR